MDLEEHVRKVLDEINPEELAELTASLVRINTVWDQDAGTSEQQAAEMVAVWAQEQGFQVEMDQVAPGRPNTIITWAADPGARTLLFEGHRCRHAGRLCRLAPCPLWGEDRRKANVRQGNQ